MSFLTIIFEVTVHFLYLIFNCIFESIIVNQVANKDSNGDK